MYDLDLCLDTEIKFPDGHFSMTGISRLAAVADINIFHELAPKRREMIKRLSLLQSLSHNPNPVDTIRVVFEEWLAGKSRLPPTWGEMMAVLREAGMIDLIVRIERYLGTASENGKFLAHEINICAFMPNGLFLPQDVITNLIPRPHVLPHSLHST